MKSQYNKSVHVVKQTLQKILTFIISTNPETAKILNCFLFLFHKPWDCDTYVSVSEYYLSWNIPTLCLTMNLSLTQTKSTYISYKITVMAEIWMIKSRKLPG